MALSVKTLTNGQWKKLSAAGENGKAWVQNVSDDGTSKIMIAHTISAQTPADDIPYGSATDLDKTIGYVLPLTGDPLDSEILVADTSADIYYATILDADETCTIIVDFI